MPTRLIEFDAAADRHIVLAAHDFGCREIHRIETGCAEAVDLDAGHGVAIARQQRRDARDVAARLPDRIDATHHHIIDQFRIEIVALAQSLQNLRGEVDRLHLMQRAVHLAASARRAQVIVDEGVGHYKLLAISNFMISLVPA